MMTSNKDIQGYIDNFRITKGHCRYKKRSFLKRILTSSMFWYGLLAGVITFSLLKLYH